MLRKAVNLVTLAHYVLMDKNTPVLSFDYDLDDHKACLLYTSTSGSLHLHVSKTQNTDFSFSLQILETKIVFVA